MGMGFPVFEAGGRKMWCETGRGDHFESDRGQKWKHWECPGQQRRVFHLSHFPAHVVAKDDDIDLVF
jgi:hypothetical protein